MSHSQTLFCVTTIKFRLHFCSTLPPAYTPHAQKMFLQDKLEERKWKIHNHPESIWFKWIPCAILMSFRWISVRHWSARHFPPRILLSAPLMFARVFWSAVIPQIRGGGWSLRKKVIREKIKRRFLKLKSATTVNFNFQFRCVGGVQQKIWSQELDSTPLSRAFTESTRLQIRHTSSSSASTWPSLKLIANVLSLS